MATPAARLRVLREVAKRPSVGVLLGWSADDLRAWREVALSGFARLVADPKGDVLALTQLGESHLAELEAEAKNEGDAS